MICLPTLSERILNDLHFSGINTEAYRSLLQPEGHPNGLVWTVSKDQIHLYSNFFNSPEYICQPEDVPELEILPPLLPPLPYTTCPSFTLQWKGTLLSHPKVTMVYRPTWKNLRRIKQMKKATQNIDATEGPSTKQHNHSPAISLRDAFLIAFHFLMLSNYLLHLVFYLWLVINDIILKI